MGDTLFYLRHFPWLAAMGSECSEKVYEAFKTYDSHKGRFLEASEEMVAALNKFDGDFIWETLSVYKLVEAIEKIFAALIEFHNLFSKLNEFHTLSVEEMKELCHHDSSKMSILALAKKKLFRFLNEFHKGYPSDMLRLGQDFGMVTFRSAFGFGDFISLFELIDISCAPHVIDKYVSKWHSHPLFNYHTCMEAAIDALFLAIQQTERLSTRQKIKFDGAIRKLLQKHPAIHKEANKWRSTPRQTQFCKAILKPLSENNSLAENTMQQMHTTPAPGVPYDDGNHVPPSIQMPMALPSNDPAPIGGSSDDDPNDIKNPRDEPSSSMEASLAHATDITSSSNCACDAGNHSPPSTQMPMAFPSNDPASVGASIDDDPNHIGNPGDEPSSPTEASPAHAPDIASSSNGAFDDGNRDPPSTRMPMALPSNDPISVGASIDDDPNHIGNSSVEPSSSTEASPAQAPDITSSSNGAPDFENPVDEPSSSTEALPTQAALVGASIDDDPNHIGNLGDEPSSSTEASPAHAPDIASSSNGACDDGNRAPPSTQMPMALPSNDPVSVGASIDDDPNHIGNPGDEPSSSTEASPAQAPDITTSSNGACDAGNHSPPSTQMPMALPSNDPASVGGSSDDDPNDIENPRDESSRSTEASPAHPLDITLSPNGASLPVRGDGSERREPPVPPGNRDLEAMDNRAIPKEVLLMFAVQVIQILCTGKSGDVSLLSRKAKILQYCAEAITGIGFFCGLGVILLRNRRNLRAATEMMSAIGFFSTALGFIATMCVPLPNEYMFWILGCIGFPFSAVFAYLLWKGWIV